MHLRERKPWSRSLWFASQCLCPGTWLEAIPFDGSMLCIRPLSLSSRPSHGPLLTRRFGSSKFSKLSETSKSPCYWSDFGARRCADFAMRMVSSRPNPWQKIRCRWVSGFHKALSQESGQKFHPWTPCNVYYFAEKWKEYYFYWRVYKGFLRVIGRCGNCCYMASPMARIHWIPWTHKRFYSCSWILWRV